MIEILVTEDLTHCHALRRAVFIDEQGVSEAEEMDDLDDQAIHLLALVDGKALGTARLFIQGEIGKIGRVCVAKEARGTGLGLELMRGAMAELSRQEGIKTLKLSAQCYAIGFYEKLGFSAYGPVYDDAGIPHRDMSCPV